MAVSRLQNGLIKSHIAPRALKLNYQFFFFKFGHILFFSNSDRDFYSENNNVLQVYTYIPKIHQKKVKKKTKPLLSSILGHFCSLFTTIQFDV
jgi:hypothetical protein